MANIERTDRRSSNSRPIGSLAKAPRDPERVLQIVRLKHNGKNFREISDVIGVSRQAPFQLYNRWHTWAEEQLK